jgi:hypothetical protein
VIDANFLTGIIVGSLGTIIFRFTVLRDYRFGYPRDWNVLIGEW